MENLDWLLQQIDKMSAQTSTFADQALLDETKRIAQEQAKRCEQAEMELDGRIWSPNKW